VLTRVRQSVIQATKGKQVPWDSSSLTGDFYFAASPAPGVTPAPPPPGAPDGEVVFWQSIRDSKSAADFKAYLDRWPQGTFAELARLRIAQLEKSADRPAPGRATEQRSAGTAFRDCPDCPEVVVVPAGEFLMGSSFDEKERFPDEGPQHRVALASSFALGKFEVTRGEFARFVRESGYKPARGCKVWRPQTGAFAHDANADWEKPGFEQSEQHPAVCVAMADALAYVAWLSKKTGQAYRLPSEAEWEYAARAGSAAPWSWGANAAEACQHANGADQSAQRRFRTPAIAACDDGHAFTAPGGSFRANGFGLYDTIGNASEWTADCWHETYAGAPVDGRAWMTNGCVQRTTRGGAWLAWPRLLRTAARGGVRADDRLSILGFRVARTLEAR
jgi:formylglycine-generating enzyme required for sulfatase activity